MPQTPPSALTDPLHGLSVVESQAALWLVQLESGEMTAEGFEALTEWLEASPEHGSALEAAELAVLRTEAAGDLIDDDEDAVIPTPAVIARARPPRSTFTPLRLSVMAGIVAIFAGAIGFGIFHDPTEKITLATAHGERLEKQLPDGTRLHLNSDTRLSVRLSDKARHYVLEKGEVFVEVTRHDNGPLTLRAGDQEIRDIGTQFNVSRLDNHVRVTVREGIVDLSTDSLNGKPMLKRLAAGDETLHREGSNEVRLIKADTEAATAWREGRAIYRGTPLSDVVADLNRYVSTPLVVDPAVQSLRLNAIIVLDTEETIVAGLTGLLPVQAVRQGGEIRLVPARAPAARTPAETTNPS